MFKKFGIGMLAVMMAVAFSAFTTVKKAAPSNSFTPVLYWYVVVNNVIPKNAPLYAHAQQASVNATFCNQSALEIDCIRGFEEELDTSENDISDTGTEQIKMDDPNTP